MEIITKEQALKELEELKNSDIMSKKLTNGEKYAILENAGFEYREIGTSKNVSYNANTFIILNVKSRKYLEDGDYLIYFTASARLGNKGTLRRGYVKKIID